MLSKSFGLIYFHFNIFSEKNLKTGVKMCIFQGFENLSQVTALYTTDDRKVLYILRVISTFGSYYLQAIESLLIKE